MDLKSPNPHPYRREKVQSMNYGTLPEALDVVAACEGEGYRIGNFHNMPEIETAINQGIDSHLEAVFFSQNGVNLTIEPDSMPVLLRRLVEMWESGNEEAGDTASCILGTLNFEWI